MSIPNRLDLLAQPFCRRWRLAWDNWSGSATDGVSGEALVEHHPGLHRELESMAYRLLRFQAGMGNLLAMARCPRRLPEVIREWFERAPAPDGFNASQQGGRLWLEVVTLPPGTPASFGPCNPAGGWRLRAWGRDPAVDEALHSGWSALLRLRPLRRFWVDQLRAKHVAALAQVLGPEWVEPDSDLPPGAVLPDLEQWSGLVGAAAVACRIPIGWQRLPLWQEGGPSLVVPPWPKPVSPVWRAEFTLNTDSSKRARLLALRRRP